jgi:uncharacterized repeat protein (TIGR01451 family)
VLKIKRLLYIWIAISVATLTFLPIDIDAEAATTGSFTITVTVTDEPAASEITLPADGKTCSRTPTVVGTAPAGETVRIRGTSGGSAVEVASTTSDTDGNFWVEVADSTPLDTGSNTLTPYVDGSAGTSVTVNIEADPSLDQEPQITSPEEGERIRGKRPTVEGHGKADETVELYALTSNITLVGSSTVGGDGSFTVTADTDLPSGTNSIYVAINGVASGVINVTLVDPYGVVFDSETDDPIAGAVLTLYYDDAGDWIVAEPGVHIDSDDENPQTTGSDGEYAYDVISGDYRFEIDRVGYEYPSTRTSFPAGRAIVTGSKGETFTVSDEIIEMDQPMDFTGEALLYITKTANRKEASVGGVITYKITIENRGGSNVDDVFLKDKIAGGFKYLSNTARIDGTSISNPDGITTKTFDIGTVPAGETKTLGYQVVVGSGVTFGNYENSAWCEFSNGRKISNTSRATVTVVPDPLFDLGTIIGKVFLDLDEDGIQRGPDEIGISGVSLVTADGTVVTTDKDGQYHLKGLKPGRYLLRLDESTLPEGGYLTTEKAVIVEITSGLISKVNFGINSRIPLEEDMPVRIIQKKETPEPFLNIALYPTPVLSYLFSQEPLERAEDRYEFRIFTNYQLFIQGWQIEVLDRDTRKVVRSISGSHLTINDPIYWDGRDQDRRWLDPERNYIYILTVTGKDGNIDRTKEKELPVRLYDPARDGQSDEESREKKLRMFEQESRLNNLAQQNIKIGERFALIEREERPLLANLIRRIVNLINFIERRRGRWYLKY